VTELQCGRRWGANVVYPSRVRAGSVLPLAVVLALVFVPHPARGEQTIIKRPGDHPHYAFEAEPHVIVGWREFRDGPGVGFRGTIPIVHNGFVSRINNSVGIGFGFDADPIRHADRFAVPIVMQWNFWLSTHWSVFGEPGAAILFGQGRDKDRPLFPVIYAGGRLHFNEAIALTLRVGYPDISLGVSFLL
jgi:hypothetical protein